VSDWASFDCYGTLVDWVSGMSAAVAPLVDDADLPRVMQAYYTAELEVQAQTPGLPYRRVLSSSLERAFARCGLELPGGEDDALVRGWGSMPVFADVGDSLGRLRADGFKLAILTNCDDDLIAQSVARMPVDIDLIVTAEQVGSYKPAHGHFEHFAQLTRGDRDAWVHCANSFVHDMVPASELAIPRVWVDRDRTGEDPAIANAHLHDLAALPALLAATRSGNIKVAPA
jgi:2-haloacid dehalogenase